MDEKQRLEQQAVEKARADVAYEAERRRLDPSYQPYSASSQRGTTSINQWASGSSAFASIDAQQAALQREWQLRNNRHSQSTSSDAARSPRP